MTALSIAITERDPIKFAHAIRQLTEGRSNAVGVVNLTSSVTSTVVTAPNCATSSNVFLFPASVHAATEFAAGTLCVKIADVKNGQFTITHVSNGLTDRTFFFVCLG